MSGRWFGLLVTGLVLGLATPAVAAPVLTMEPNGRVRVEQDRFLPPAARTPVPAAGASLAQVTSSSHPAGDVTAALERLHREGRITTAAYRGYRRDYRDAVASEGRLRGTRTTELGAVIANLKQLTAQRLLTPARLPALFLTLDRNRQWWTHGPIPSTWQRVEFSGSQLVWEYYPGQGIELQVLGTFSKATGLYTAGRSQYPQLDSVLNEMLPLAVRRGGGLAWEYYFQFDGGNPPWVSAMAQGTALEALARGYKAAERMAPGSGAPYLQAGSEALGIFETAPPTGVRTIEPNGSRYLQYSFAPDTDIINAFLQSLIGLYDYARVSHDTQAEQLFEAGNTEAQAELPSFDTGAWSLYEPGVEDSLSYHILVTGFLRQLCRRTKAAVYCTEARRFRSYLKTPPVVALLTTRVRARTPAQLRFQLSKYSHVGIVLTCHGRILERTSADFPYGQNSLSAPGLPAGICQVTLSATDLAGNSTRDRGTLTVARQGPGGTPGGGWP